LGLIGLAAPEKQRKDKEGKQSAHESNLGVDGPVGLVFGGAPLEGREEGRMSQEELDGDEAAPGMVF
jgi:hypothetical protein